MKFQSLCELQGDTESLALISNKCTARNKH